MIVPPTAGQRGERNEEKAFLHLKIGHTEKACSYFDSMRVEAENELSKDPMNAGALSKLGLA